MAHIGGFGWVRWFGSPRESPLTPALIIYPLDHLPDWPPYVCNKDRPTQSVSSQSFYPCFVPSVLSVRPIASWKECKNWTYKIGHIQATDQKPHHDHQVREEQLRSFWLTWLPIDCPAIADRLPGSQALPTKPAKTSVAYKDTGLALCSLVQFSNALSSHFPLGKLEPIWLSDSLAERCGGPDRAADN